MYTDVDITWFPHPVNIVQKKYMYVPSTKTRNQIFLP